MEARRRPRTGTRARRVRSPRLRALLAATALLSSTLVLAGGFFTSAHADTTPGSISGTVTNTTGGALVNICVYAAPPHGGGNAGGSAKTDSSGKYTISNVPVGSYSIQFVDCNGGDYVQQWYNDKTDPLSADTVSVTAGAALSGIDAHLTLGGSISGTIRNSGGTALTGICAGALQGNASSGASSDSAGRYTIHGVMPGPTVVDFNDCSGGNYIQQWYKGVATRANATSFTVTSGVNTGGIDASMALGGEIDGTLTDTSNAPAANVCVAAHVDAMTWSGMAVSGPDGSYAVHALPAGTYRVEFGESCGPNHQFYPQWYLNQSSFNSATPVNVTSGAATHGINQQLIAGGSISGTITDSSGSSLAGMCAFPMGTKQEPVTGVQPTDSSGHYSVAGLVPGQYRVLFSDCSGGNYVQQWYQNATYQSAKLVTVSSGADTTNVSALMQLGGSISGTVTDQSNRPLDRIYVAANNQSGFGSGAQTAADGTYTMHGVPTGPNRLYFVDFTGDHVGQYYNNHADPSAADQVSVSANANTPGINASLAAGGAIAGTLKDSSGNPAVGYCVLSYPSTSSQYSYLGSGCADSAGAYTVHGIPAGNAKVYFFNPAQNTSQWYHSKADFNSADVVAVVVGSTTGGIDDTVAASTVGTPPSAPTNVTATASDRQASVSWTAPASSGSGPISRYVVTANPGGATAQAAGSTTSTTVTGLENGVSYTFTVHAVNDAGNGPESAPSAPVTPIGPSITKVASSANPSVWGQPVTLTASVSSASGASGTPTGQVTFMDGSTTLGTAALSSGTASLTVGNLQVGAHSITATYSGDAAFTSSSSTAITQTVNKAATQTTITSLQNPSVYGGRTIKATVQAVSPGAGVPTGNVTFSPYDGMSADNNPLDSTGTTYGGEAIPAGGQSVSATYAGDDHFQPSRSNTISQTVQQASTDTSVEASSTSATTNTPVRLTARVSPQYANCPTGVVEFFNGTQSIGQATLACAGGVSIATRYVTLPAGDAEITARYDGDSNFTTSESQPPVGVTVTDYSGGGGGGTCSCRPPSYGQPTGDGVRPTFTTPYQTIRSTGPLTNITVTAQLGCSIKDVHDQFVAFHDGVDGCETAIDLDGTHYAPGSFTPVSQSAVLGSGSATSPYRIITVVRAGALQVTETDTYVVGDEAYTTSLAFVNLSTNSLSVNVGRTGDCYVSDWDSGYGYADDVTSSVGCREAVIDHSVNSVPLPGARVLVWRPADTTASYVEGDYRLLGSTGNLASTCACDTYVDNAAGLGWSLSLGPAGSSTISHATGFETILPEQPGPPPPPPPSNSPTVQPAYFALGDSIPSGHGLKPYSSVDCKRSVFSYPSTVASLMWYYKLAYESSNVACSGASTSDIGSQAQLVAAKIRERTASLAQNHQASLPIDAYISVDGGIDNEPFAGPSSSYHLACDDSAHFQAWWQGVLTSVQGDFVGSVGASLGVPAPTSILGRLLGAGNTTIVLQGYYNPIQENTSHPLVLWWQRELVHCPGANYPLNARAAWALDQFDRSLQNIVSQVNRVVPPNTLGPRLRFVQFEDLFSGNTSCTASSSYVQNTGQPFGNDWYQDGDDCVHPSLGGARIIAYRILAAFREQQDTIGHTSPRPIPFPG